MELFRKPTAEYRGAPFWAWNCKLDRDQILRQIDYFKEMGFGGFHMHSRVGMASEYLGEEFMGHIKACAEKAKNENMLAWLYDEDRWASGAAGGYLTKEKKYRKKYLRFSQTRPHTLLTDKVLAYDAGEPYFLAAYDLSLDEEGKLASYCRIGIDEEAKGAKWYASVRTLPDDPWFNNQAYPDTMDEETIAKFIEITYEAYYKAVGEDFDGAVPAIFTDEPNCFCYNKIYADRAKDTDALYATWSRFWEEKYEERYGEDILERLPELFWMTPDSRDSLIKYRYYDLCAELFARAFSDQCGKWCEDHGLALTGHILREATLKEQVPATGDNMRQYRSFTIPGIDILCDNVELNTAKQCQSVVHQMGKEAMLSELYGVTNWDFDFRGHKFQGDWQAALGVTVRVPHLSWMSMAGEAKRDYPASIFYQSAWYKEYPYLEDHFARLNTALTRGTPVVRVGLIHPTESFWIQSGPNDQTGKARAVMDENFASVTKWLLESHQDFNFINESMLPALAKEDAPRMVGMMEYDAIVVAGCKTLRQTTLDYLAKFQKCGGKVIFMGDCPSYVDGIKGDGAKALFDQSEGISFDQSALIDALEDCRKVDIRLQSGLPADQYLYQLRQDGADQWLFIARFKKKEMLTYREQRSHKGEQPNHRLEITLQGEWNPQIYDTVSGKVYPAAFRHEGGKTIVSHSFYESDSLLLHLSAPLYSEFNPQKEEVIKLGQVDFKNQLIYEREEDNVLLLDLAEYRLDQGEWQPKEEILRLDNKVRDELGFPGRMEKFAQPWVTPDMPAEHTVSLRFEVNSKIRIKEAFLALEDAESAEISWNGKKIENTVVGWYVDESIKKVALPPIKKGINLLEITLPFARRSNLEACYILGDFDVEVHGCEAMLIAPSEKIGFGSLTSQGMPFYGGNITYHLPFEAPCDCDLEILLGKYKGALCKVVLDEGEAKKIAFSPYESSFRKVKKGHHVLHLTVFGHRFNTFGCVHNCADNYSWIGPDAWRTLGNFWSYEYQLKEMGMLTSPTLKFIKK